MVKNYKVVLQRHSTTTNALDLLRLLNYKLTPCLNEDSFYSSIFTGIEASRCFYIGCVVICNKSRVNYDDGFMLQCHYGVGNFKYL